MDRKTKHRILASCVVTGLIVIMLPLFQDNSELAAETPLIKAPPFPDQTVQVAVHAANVNPQFDPQQITHETEPNIQLVGAQTWANASAVDQTKSQEQDRKIERSSEKILDVKETIKNTSATHNKTSISARKDIKFIKAIKDNHIQVKPKNVDLNTIAKNIKTKNNSLADHQEVDNNGLINLKNAVWVVEVGQFSSKTAALRLVNQLRIAGHRAFIETAWGDGMTHVFIGPENKEQKANLLAEKLNKNLHLHTMVLRYQPFAM